MKTLARLAPLLLIVLALAWIGSKMVRPGVDSEFRLDDFAALPVVYQGRVKPLDTLARNSLTIISDRQVLRDEDGERRPAIEWLLDVMANSPAAENHAVFRIHNLQLLSQLGLERRKGYRFAWSEFVTRLPEVEMQAAQASRLSAAERDVYDAKVLEFYQRVLLYRILADTHATPDSDLDTTGGVMMARQRLQSIERFTLPLVIPPQPDSPEWKSMLRGRIDVAKGDMAGSAVTPLAAMLESWNADDPTGFNDSLATYREYLAGHPVAGTSRLKFEVMFSRAAPFYHCSVLYVLAFVLGCVGWLRWPDTLRRCTYALLVTTLVIHTLAITSRIYISGYPPITNLYGTSVFIGWGCVVLGLILERFYTLGVGNLLSSVVGFLTLLIAHFLSGDGDTLEMMQAVLDTKFWLATHVIIINFGYSATFLAGGLAAVYLVRGVATRSIDPSIERAFGRMMYGVVCFALLLSFIGTVLGGLWADDSWGRFWGWDPKENGALMIVLWNALILHARWGGLVKTRGIAVLSVFGNIVTAWSWFGVNQLGVGLHSYGFTDSVAFWLMIFVASQLAVIGIGLVPRRFWRSHLERTADRGTTTAPPTITST